MMAMQGETSPVVILYRNELGKDQLCKTFCFFGPSVHARFSGRSVHPKEANKRNKKDQSRPRLWTRLIKGLQWGILLSLNILLICATGLCSPYMQIDYYGREREKG